VTLPAAYATCNYVHTGLNFLVLFFAVLDVYGVNNNNNNNNMSKLLMCVSFASKTDGRKVTGECYNCDGVFSGLSRATGLD
jgi:hypothetical protein